MIGNSVMKELNILSRMFICSTFLYLLTLVRALFLSHFPKPAKFCELSNFVSRMDHASVQLLRCRGFLTFAWDDNFISKKQLNIRCDCFTFFKMSLNSNSNLVEESKIEMLIIASITTLEKSTKNEVETRYLIQFKLAWTLILPVRHSEAATGRI